MIAALTLLAEQGPGNLDVAAINDAQYAVSSVCGACAEVTGPKGSLTVRIVDRCPGCKRGDLDLSRQAFAKIAVPAEGRVPIEWRLVSCAVAGPFTYDFAPGSSRYWLGLQVRNARVPVKALEWHSDGKWKPFELQNHNYFVVSSEVEAGPLRLRITGWEGQQVEDTLAAIKDKGSLVGKAQFAEVP